MRKLSKEEMKGVTGGDTWVCYATNSDGEQVSASSEPTSSSGMAGLDAWVGFWDAAGGSPYCKYYPTFYA